MDRASEGMSVNTGTRLAFCFAVPARSVTMEEITIDLGRPSYRQPEPIKPGSYLAQVIDVRPGKTSEGRPKYGILLRLERGKQAGRTIWTNLVLEPARIERLRAFLKAIGEPCLDTVSLRPSYWKGRLLMVQVGVQMDREPHNVILKFHPTATTRQTRSPRPNPNRLVSDASEPAEQSDSPDESAEE
jgi:hypothetical protein